MTSEINLYEDSHYIGFYPVDYVDIFFEQYEEYAYDLAERLSRDSVVLFAVYEYYPENQAVYSADFMMYTMPYELYAEFASAMMTTSRLFFMRGRKD